MYIAPRCDRRRTLVAGVERIDSSMEFGPETLRADDDF